MSDFGSYPHASAEEVLLQAIRTEKLKQSIHANNLANAHTVGYKRIRATFADLLYEQIQRPGFNTPGISPAGTFFGTGVRVTSTVKMFTQGGLEVTERQLDLALDGDGFFRVLLPDGQVAYTRGGNFNTDAEGNLVTAEGFLLEPAFTVPENTIGITVDSTGRLFVIDPANPETPQEVGQFELSCFINASGLEPIGDNLYLASAASGQPVDGNSGDRDQGFGLIRQGFLENSNVDVEREKFRLNQATQHLKKLQSLLDRMLTD